MTLIYTSQSSRMTKKQKAKQAAIRKEQQSIKKDLERLRNEHKSFFTSTVVPYRRTTVSYPSVDTGVGVAPMKESKVYTGDKMIGIGQLHKSNAVPVFKQEEAVELASMRR